MSWEVSSLTSSIARLSTDLKTFSLYPVWISYFSWRSTLVLSACITLNIMVPSSRKPLHCYWKVAIRVPWRFFLQPDQMQIHQSLSQAKCSKPWQSWCTPLSLLQFTGAFLLSEVPKLDAVSRHGLMSAESRGIITSACLPAVFHRAAS